MGLWSVIASVSLFYPLSAAAFGGSVSPMAQTPVGLDCMIRDGASVVVYILHMNTDGSQGSRYTAVPPSCNGWVWVSETNNFAFTGDSQAGVDVTYGNCLGMNGGIIHVQTITFAGGQQSVGCCVFRVGPYSGDASPMSQRCDGEYEPAYGTSLVSRPANQPASVCPCGGIPIPTHESTWGAIKALFASE